MKKYDSKYDNYDIGQRLRHKNSGFFGVVISSDRLMDIAPKIILSGDICVEWDNSMASTYDKDWLEENCEVIQWP